MSTFQNHNKRIAVFVLFFCFVSQFINAEEEGTKCQLSPTKIGVCISIFDCEDAIIPDVDSYSSYCDITADVPLVCCSNDNGGLHPWPSEIDAPVSLRNSDYTCGVPYDLVPDKDENEGNDINDIDYINDIENNIASNDFPNTLDEIYLNDMVNFTNINETSNELSAFPAIYGATVVGGNTAKRNRAYYMALVGVLKNGFAKWVCDGVLINRQWVLSAAHCFLKLTAKINVVRLGDYDLLKSSELNNEVGPEDFEVDDIIRHPKFKVKSRYHDLALVKMKKPISVLQNSMNPVCLPWGKDTNLNHVGNFLTLTGWGKTKYSDGEKSSILQEVLLNVFNTSVCDKIYRTLPNYKYRFEYGMTDDTILCAGSKKGDKDACQGDSGAPLTYQNKNNYYVLAAIVSGGNGCAKKKFPGYYIPINNPFYLEWIKEIAF